ncbi:MAG: DUF4160 domain-containing protein [Alphaproteobacteria bacterium]
MRFEGLRVAIYPNDHRPAHVHVIGPQGETVFVLHCPDGPPELRESHGFGGAEITRVRAALARRLVGLCESWRRFHGRY